MNVKKYSCVIRNREIHDKKVGGSDVSAVMKSSMWPLLWVGRLTYCVIQRQLSDSSGGHCTYSC